MKKTLFSIVALCLYTYVNAQSITLSSGSGSYRFTIKSGGTSTGYYGDISTSETSGFQYYYVSSTPSSLGTEVGNIFSSGLKNYKLRLRN